VFHLKLLGYDILITATVLYVGV